MKRRTPFTPESLDVHLRSPEGTAWRLVSDGRIPRPVILADRIAVWHPKIIADWSQAGRPALAYRFSERIRNHDEHLQAVLDAFCLHPSRCDVPITELTADHFRDDIDDGLLRIEQLASRWQCTADDVWKLVHFGELVVPVIVCPGCPVWHAHVVEDWKAAGMPALQYDFSEVIPDHKSHVRAMLEFAARFNRAPAFALN